MEKLEWRGYQVVKNFEDIFIRFDMIHERDRRTDGRTPCADIGHAYASHRAAKIVKHDSWPIQPDILNRSDYVPHCRILSPDKTKWRLISATLCG